MDAGWGALTVFSALARTLPGAAGHGSVTAKDLADEFERYIAAYGANASNLLAYAPGGGVENIGLSQGLNDMLLQSSNGTLHLFPAWCVPPIESHWHAIVSAGRHRPIRPRHR